jgi:conjugative transfer signal peptidase TraF
MPLTFVRVLRFYAIAAAFVILAYATGKAIEESGHELIVNTSPSMPRGIYWMARNARPVQRGDVVMFAPPNAVRDIVYGRGWLLYGMPLLKTVGGIAGDVYCVRERRFLIDNRDVGPTFLLDAQGDPLPQMTGCRRVRAGEFLPVSTFIERSFDARYFGAVPSDNVLGVGRLLGGF